MWKMLAISLLLSGCGLMPDKTYVLDGVPVTLKNGQGPEMDHLWLAVQLYRREARVEWAMTGNEELQFWRSLRQIVWTSDMVLNRAHYDAGTQILYANWLGCALDVPFYQALTNHYWADETPETAVVWADEQTDANMSVVCNGSDSGWF
jgi:hypothetical protein